MRLQGRERKSRAKAARAAITRSAPTMPKRRPAEDDCHHYASNNYVTRRGPADWPPKFREPPDLTEDEVQRLRAQHDLRVCQGFFHLAKAGCDTEWLFEHLGYYLRFGAHRLTSHIVDVHHPDEQHQVLDVFCLSRPADATLERWRLLSMRRAIILYLAVLVRDKASALAQMGSPPQPPKDDGDSANIEDDLAKADCGFDFTEVAPIEEHLVGVEAWALL